MFLFTKPDARTIERFIVSQRHAGFSYSAIGATKGQAPIGYNVDHNRVKLGNGELDFEKAKAAVESWKMFDMPWVELHRPQTPIEAGREVAILIKHFGFWSLNAARIIYVIGEGGDIERFGFAYGTLAEHGETGEERFSVELHRSSGEVWYDLYAFSKPNHFLAKLGYFLSRGLQRRFAAESKLAMRRAVDPRAID